MSRKPTLHVVEQPCQSPAPEETPGVRRARQSAEAIAVLRRVEPRALVLGGTSPRWRDTADVLRALLEAPPDLVAKLADVVRKADSKRRDNWLRQHRKELTEMLHNWDGREPTPDALADRLLDETSSTEWGAIWGAEAPVPGYAFPDEPPRREICSRADAIARVATALRTTLERCHAESDQGETLARAVYRALGVSEVKARSLFDPRER